MPGDLERAILIRQFRGVDISRDPIFIGTDRLQRSDNWIPSPIFLLEKRPGTSLLRHLKVDLPAEFAGTNTFAPTLFRAYDDAGNRYLFAVGRSTVGQTNDALFVSTN